MTSATRIRESAFHDIDQVGLSDYRDNVIKIEIHGQTVNEIDHVAQAAGLTSAQWIRVTLAAALTKCE